jgi:hypothetical protein
MTATCRDTMAAGLELGKARDEKGNIIDCALLVWSNVSINETCASCRSERRLGSRPSFWGSLAEYAERSRYREGCGGRTRPRALTA